MRLDPNMDASPPSRPRMWKYILGAVLAFPVSLLLWLWFDLQVWHPEALYVDRETTMDKVRWFGVPLLVIAVLFGGKWLKDAAAASVREHAWQQKVQQLREQEEAARSEQARREYVLEVLGLGVTFEKYRQGKFLEALQQGHPFTTIRETDPKKYPWSRSAKNGNTGNRACDALENGAVSTPMYWGVPTMYAGGPFEDPAYQPSEIDPMAGLAASADGTGMAWHLFVTGPWAQSEYPDRLLEKAFAIFDQYPDLPYLVLLAADDMGVREEGLPHTAPLLINDGYYIPERPDASAVFILARRERVEPLRPYIWEDPDNNYLQENLRMMYYQVKEDVPTPEKLANPKEFHIGRNPTIAEWLPAASDFARNPVYEKKDGNKLIDAFKRWTNHPPKDWKPTPWFPLPWNRDQMDTFDRLPSLGFVHRPVFIRFEDKEGKPAASREARQQMLALGWQQALLTLPAAVRSKGPARIIAAFDHHVDQTIALELMLHQYAAEGGPKIDTGSTRQFINMDHRLGNTGAATFFMQMAIGIMGSYRDGGPSAAINLRDPGGASIVFISPPAPERLQAQQNWDVFRNRVGPSIDPDNYKPPTMSQVFGQSGDSLDNAVSEP